MTTGDRPLLEALRSVLSAGAIQDRGARRPAWKPESRMTLASEAAHLGSTIPFFDRYLADSAKRRQFEAWRDALLEYRSDRRHRGYGGRSTCSVLGCERTVRGQGLCRHHYYEATGW